MGYLIDSSVFIGLERGRLPLRVLATALPSETVALSVVTVSELLVGAHRARSHAQRLEREAFVEQLLEAFPVLPFDLRCARVHASIGASLTADGRTIGAHDLLIAATALAHAYAVVTLNIRDFDWVPGLRVIRLPQPW